MASDSCAHCRQALGSTITVGPEGAWLHPDCLRPYLRHVGAEITTALMYEGDPPSEADAWRYPLEQP